MAALDVVTPTGLGKQMKAAVNTNRDGVTDSIVSALGGILTTRSTTARPSADPNTTVVFYTPTPPVSIMLPGDVWQPTT